MGSIDSLFICFEFNSKSERGVGSLPADFDLGQAVWHVEGGRGST